MKISKLIILQLIVLVAASLVSCKKYDDNLTIPAEQVHFVNKRSGNYKIMSATVNSFPIAVGTTTVSSASRSANISVFSKTAVEGTHYTLNKKTVTFPSGKVTDTLFVTATTAGINQYLAGRIDTVYFVIQGDKASQYNDTFRLRIGPCYESEINSKLFAFEGEYFNTYDDFFDGPYKTTISFTKYLSATSANIVIKNLFDLGLKDALFTLDWSTGTIRVIGVEQNLGGDAGTVFGAAYNGYPFIIRPVAGGTAAFCDETITPVINLLIQNPTTGAYLTAANGMGIYLER